jgi:hypothetical protein
MLIAQIKQSSDDISAIFVNIKLIYIGIPKEDFHPFRNAFCGVIIRHMPPILPFPRPGPPYFNFLISFIGTLYTIFFGNTNIET